MRSKCQSLWQHVVALVVVLKPARVPAVRPEEAEEYEVKLVLEAVVELETSESECAGLCRLLLLGDRLVDGGRVVDGPYSFTVNVRSKKTSSVKGTNHGRNSSFNGLLSHEPEGKSSNEPRAGSGPWVNCRL